MSDTANAALQTRALAKVYRSGEVEVEVEVQALRGVDLTLQSGDLVVLLGPSGSGKSTLLNILGGLDTASSGSLWFRGTELTGSIGNSTQIAAL